MSRTVCTDFESGLQLAVYLGRLTQVKKGADFYVGQIPYVVMDIEQLESEDLLINLKRKEAKQP